jgi:type I restriction enzyme S subunit
MSGLAALKGGGAESGLSAIKQYRNSEVGLIPAEWELRSVGRFAAIKTGPFGTLLKASEYASGDGVPLISVGEIRDGFLKVLEHTPRVEPIVTRRLPEYLLREGDIIFGRKGGVDRSAIVLAHQDGWFLGSDGISVRPGSDCHSPYIAFQFQSSRIKKWLLQNAIGTTMPSLNQDVLGKVIVPFPPTLAEQHAIAEALSDADALIEGLSSLIAKKRAIKQGAMQDLLTGKRRLPGFKGEWELKRLGEIGESLIGLTYSPLDVRESGTLVLRSSNIQEGALRFDDNVFVERDVPERIRVQNGDILICVRNGSRDLIGKCAKIDARCAGMTFGAFMAVFRTPSHDFVFHQFKSDGIKRQIQEHLGATINQITNKSLNSFVIRVPPNLAEQQAVAGVLSDMDTEIEALDGKLAKARAIKQGMMQELLTGRVRLV